MGKTERQQHTTAPHMMEKLFKLGIPVSVITLLMRTLGIAGPADAHGDVDTQAKRSHDAAREKAATQLGADIQADWDEAREKLGLEPESGRKHLPPRPGDGEGRENVGQTEQLQQQENAPAVVPEFPLTENDVQALESYFQQQYGTSIEQAVGDQGYVVFELDIATDGSPPVSFDQGGPLAQQLEIVKSAVDQVDPNHTAIGLQMNLGVKDGQYSLGFAIVYQKPVGLRSEGTLEYLSPENQFKYLEGVKKDTEVVLFRVDQATSEQIGNLELIENGETIPIQAPEEGSLMLVERYPDDDPDESKRGVVVSFIVGDRALVVESELADEQTNAAPQVVGAPVATPAVNNIELASFSPESGSSVSEENTSDTSTTAIWERYSVSEEVYNDVLFDYPRDILNRLTLPEGDPNRMTYNAEYGTVVDSQGRAWFPDIAPAGSPESESYVTLMDTFVDTENNITYNLFMNPEAYSDRRIPPFKSSVLNSAGLKLTDTFRRNILQIDSEFLAQWSGYNIQIVTMANYDTSRRSQPGEPQHILGEEALGIEIGTGNIVIRLYEGEADAGDVEYHQASMSSTLSAALTLLAEIEPEGPHLTGDYVAKIYKRGQGGWQDNVYRILVPLMEYDSATREYLPLIQVE